MFFWLHKLQGVTGQESLPDIVTEATSFGKPIQVEKTVTIQKRDSCIEIVFKPGQIERRPTVLIVSSIAVDQY